MILKLDGLGCYHVWVKGLIGLSICRRCGNITDRDVSVDIRSDLFSKIYRKFNVGEKNGKNEKD